MDTEHVRWMIRLRLQDGRLPRGDLAGVVRVRGDGDCCAACDVAVGSSETGVSGIAIEDWKDLWLHDVCFQLWDVERRIRFLPDRHRLLTLGDVLFHADHADDPRQPVPEAVWVGLVQSVAARNPHALHALYTRMYGVVFAWSVQVLNDWETSQELTLNVFHDVWREASTYDPAGNSVVGWIMGQARSRTTARQQFEEPISLRSVRQVVVLTPADALRPSPFLWERLTQRIAVRPRNVPFLLPGARGVETEWNEVAAGISCQLLAADRERHRVSMLVHLAPGVAYPPHTHAGVEELYLLHGELMIEDRKLYPGDYNRAEPGSGDQFVWSETGCICVLLTSTRDVLR